MNEIKIHPVADLLPMMNEAEIAALAQDLKQNGMREPIVIFVKDGERLIIDGRNRFQAAKIAEIKPKFKEYTGTEESLVNYVISLNISRRHLSPSQKSCLAITILPVLEEQTKINHSKKISAIRSGGTATEKPKRSAELAAEMFGVSSTNIKSAKRLKLENEDLFGRVLAGELSINKALGMLKGNKNETNLTLSNEEVVEVVAPVAEANVSTLKHLELSKLESKKVSEYIEEFGVTEDKAIAFIVKRRKVKSTITKPKSSFSNRIEFKVDESEKSELMRLAKERGLSLSEFIRSVLNQKL